MNDPRIPRRAIVASIAALFSGCVGRGDGDATDSTPSETTVPSSETPPGGSPTPSPTPPSVTFLNPAVRKIIATPDTDTAHVEPIGYAESQFLVVELEVPDSSNLDAREIEVNPTVDGRELEQRQFPIGTPSDFRTSTTFAVRVPTGAYDSVSLRTGPIDGESVTWQVPDELVKQLGSSPAFVVSALDVPEQVDHGESFSVEFTVENVGDRRGTFLYEVGDTATFPDHSEESRTVDAGEYTSVDSFISPKYTDETDELFVRVNWGIDAEARTVDVR